MRCGAKRRQTGRSPHGERGLKFLRSLGKRLLAESLPAWGAWIEIVTLRGYALVRFGRSPHGERGLKFLRQRSSTAQFAVAPRMGSVD